MTVRTAKRRHRFQPGGAMAVEAIPFPYLDAASLVVSLHQFGLSALLSRDVDYALLGDGAAQGGSIKPLRVFPAGAEVEVLRITVPVQDTRIVPQQPFPAVSAERSLDRVTMAVQEAVDDVGGVADRALMLPIGEFAAAVPSGGVRSQRLLGFNGIGDPIASSFTIDQARSAIEAPFRPEFAQLAENVLWWASSPLAVARSLRDKARDNPVSARDFGAIGDDLTHRLSERYATLADAQVKYAFATSLDQTLDWAGIQLALFETGNVFVPRGRYRISDPIRMPNFAILTGEDDLTIIDNQNFAVTGGAQIVNDNADFCNNITLRNIRFHGSAFGTPYGMKIDVNVACEGWLIDNCKFELHGITNIAVNRLLQTSVFRNVIFGDAQYGVSVSAFTTNACDFWSCSWQRIKRSCLYLRSAEGVNVYGGRMEAGGSAGFATIDLVNAGAVNFIGTYFENTGSVLLKEAASRSSCSFTGCHFTGWTPPGQPLQQYTVDSPGLVSFVNCHAPLGIGGILNAVVRNCVGKIGDATTTYHGGDPGRPYLARPQFTLAARVPLLRFKRAGADGARSNLAIVAGTLQLQGVIVDAANANHTFARTFKVRCMAKGNNTMLAVAAVEPVNNDDNMGGITLSVEPMADPTGVLAGLDLAITGIDWGTSIHVAGWTASFINSATVEIDRIEVLAA